MIKSELICDTCGVKSPLELRMYSFNISSREWELRGQSLGNWILLPRNQFCSPSCYNYQNDKHISQDQRKEIIQLVKDVISAEKKSQR